MAIYKSNTYEEVLGAMILLTGGAGYIGAHINKVLHERGYKTVVLDNLSTGHREFVRWGKFIQSDVGNVDVLKCLFEKYPIKVVIHLAAFVEVSESMIEPQKYYENNVCNTIKLLRMMSKYNIKYFIFSSSCAVYGIPQIVPIPEEHPLAPINPYGRTKWIIEEILRDYSISYDLKYVSLRYFNAAGADIEGEIGEWHEPETHLIPIVLQTALKIREYTEIYGTDYDTPDGTCIRDYIHVTDLAYAHLLAVEYLNAGGRSDVFNLGNEKGYSVKEVIDMATKLTGRQIFVREVSRRPGDPPILVASSEKIKKVLGWQPKFTSLWDIEETAYKWMLKFYQVSNC